MKDFFTVIHISKLNIYIYIRLVINYVKFKIDLVLLLYSSTVLFRTWRVLYKRYNKITYKDRSCPEKKPTTSTNTYLNKINYEKAHISRLHIPVLQMYNCHPSKETVVVISSSSQKH